MKSTLTTLNQELAQVCLQVRESVVQINNERRGVGSGVIWHADGLIVTNAHVVLAGAATVSDHLSVTLHDGRVYAAKVVAHSRQLDIAAVAVDAGNLPAIARGDSRHISAGDWVTSMGFPWGIPGAVTSGVVVGSGAQLPELSGTQREWIAASLHLRPGHSGGPMFNSRGQLVGINTIMTGPDVGGAVPIHVVEQFLQKVDKMRHAPESVQHKTVIV